MDHFQEYLKTRGVNEKKYDFLKFFKFLLILFFMISILGSFILFTMNVVLSILSIIGSVLIFSTFYLFSLMVESIFEIHKKINEL